MWSHCCSLDSSTELCLSESALYSEYSENTKKLKNVQNGKQNLKDQGKEGNSEGADQNGGCSKAFIRYLMLGYFKELNTTE